MGEGLAFPHRHNPGSDLLSHAGAGAVPSALEGLTPVFGMGTGVAPPATPPGTLPRTLGIRARTSAHFVPADFAAGRHENLRHGSCVRIPGFLVRQKPLPATPSHGASSIQLPLQFIPSSPRPISTGRLKTSRPLHLRPINQVVLLGSYSVTR